MLVLYKRYLPLFLAFSLFVFSYGVIVGHHQTFPYQFIKLAKRYVAPTHEPSGPNERTTNAHKLFQHVTPKADIAFIGDSLTVQAHCGEFFPYDKFVNRGVGRFSVSDTLNNYAQILDVVVDLDIEVFIQSTVQCGISHCK